MTILLPTLAVTFAAFCVWLMVRIMNPRERWAKWTLVAAVGVPVLYMASFGPACWWFGRKEYALGLPEMQCAPRIYWPIGQVAADNSAGPLGIAIDWYATLGTDEVVIIPTYSTRFHHFSGRRRL